MGNRLFGNDGLDAGKSYLTLCRKVYLFHCRRRFYLLSIITEDNFLDNVPRNEPELTGDSETKTERKKPAKGKKKKSFWGLVNWKWIVTVFLSSLAISIIMSILSSEIVDYLNVFFSLLILLMFIGIGVMFDIIGLAVATADAAPFHSMAARKVKAGRIAVKLIKNADQVSSFCNDVIGDICGVVSGSTAAAIAIKIATAEGSLIFLNLLICGLVSALTVGFKAIGKVAGFRYSRQIVYAVSKVAGIFIFEKKPKKKKHKNN